MYVYDLKFNADTRVLSLVSQSPFIGSAYDDQVVVLKFEILDPSERLKDMAGRVQTAVQVTDVQSHRSWCPFYPVDTFNQCILPKELLASATAKKVPIVLIYENATLGEEAQIASNELVLKLTETPSCCPREVRPLPLHKSFAKAHYDQQTGILSIYSHDNAKTTIRLQTGTAGPKHYTVETPNDLLSITDAGPGDTATVITDPKYGDNAWYLYIDNTVKFHPFGHMFEYGRTLDADDMKLQLKDVDGTVISEIDAPGGIAEEPNRAMMSDADKRVVVSEVSSDELATLKGSKTDTTLQVQIDERTPWETPIGPWERTRVYNARSIVTSERTLYMSRRDDNVGRHPSDETWWQSLSTHAGGASAYRGTFGNAEDTEYLIDHNLDTTYFTYNLFDTVSGQNIDASVYTLSATRIKVSFTEPPGANRIGIVVFGGGAYPNGMRFVQDVPATEWVIEHNLGRYVSVQTFDEEGTQMIGLVQQVSNMKAKVTFANEKAGYAVVV